MAAGSWTVALRCHAEAHTWEHAAPTGCSISCDCWEISAAGELKRGRSCSSQFRTLTVQAARGPFWWVPLPCHLMALPWRLVGR